MSVLQPCTVTCVLSVSHVSVLMLCELMTNCYVWKALLGAALCAPCCSYKHVGVFCSGGQPGCGCVCTYLPANTYITTRIQSEQCGCVLNTDKPNVMFQLLQMIYSLNFFLRFNQRVLNDFAMTAWLVTKVARTQRDMFCLLPHLQSVIRAL